MKTMKRIPTVREMKIIVYRRLIIGLLLAALSLLSGAAMIFFELDAAWAELMIYASLIGVFVGVGIMVTAGDRSLLFESKTLSTIESSIKEMSGSPYSAHKDLAEYLCAVRRVRGGLRLSTDESRWFNGQAQEVRGKIEVEASLASIDKLCACSGSNAGEGEAA